MHNKIPDLTSVKNFARLYPEQFPENRTRDLIYHAVSRISARGETIAPNGFASCIIRRAGRVLIDLDAVSLWIESGRVAPLAKPNEGRHDLRQRAAPAVDVQPHEGMAAA